MRLCPFCGSRASDPEWVCTNCKRSPEKAGSYLLLAPEAAEETRGFDPAFFTHLAPVEAGSFWFRGRSALIVWALRRYFAKATSLFEIGCGTGFVLASIRAAFPALRLCGSEVLAAGLPYASARVETVELFQMDARRIPFDREFDVVCAFDVLEHVEEDGEMLEQMHRAVRPGGGIILTVPQHPWLWSRADSYARHVRRYRKADLVAKVEAVGFSPLRVTSFVSLLMPPLIASRVWDRMSKGEFDPLAEFRSPRFVDALFAAFLKIELWCIRLGFSFPAGGSLLLVARRNEN